MHKVETIILQKTITFFQILARYQHKMVTKNDYFDESLIFTIYEAYFKVENYVHQQETTSFFMKRWNLASYKLYEKFFFIFCLSVLDIYTIILCFPCNMPKYVPRFEDIMHNPEGSALYLLTLGHILAYFTDYTILLLLLL